MSKGTNKTSWQFVVAEPFRAAVNFVVAFVAAFLVLGARALLFVVASVALLLAVSVLASHAILASVVPIHAASVLASESEFVALPALVAASPPSGLATDSKWNYRVAYPLSVPSH